MMGWGCGVVDTTGWPTAVRQISVPGTQLSGGVPAHTARRVLSGLYRVEDDLRRRRAWSMLLPATGAR